MRKPAPAARLIANLNRDCLPSVPALRVQPVIEALRRHSWNILQLNLARNAEQPRGVSSAACAAVADKAIAKINTANQQADGTRNGTHQKPA